ncbi:hypothetical protein NE865_09014 [Phthorimaea operculella]|nr:hypothetical protein NE865_09014 [Phthorimaea operculella]
MGDKCTFGTRAPIDIHMLNEIIYREVKHFRNYKIYRPNFGSVPVTGKFYASHDQIMEERDEKAKIDEYHENVASMRAKGPHTKYPAPATENQRYGWYFKPVLAMDRNDRRFFHGRRESIHTKIEVIIAMSNPKNKQRAAG